MNGVFQLGDWTVDINRNQISKSGVSHRLENKPMKLLHFLMQHAQQDVTRDAIIQSVWGGATHYDDSLTVAMSNLRQALGDDPKNPNYIKTIPRHGYRLLVQPSSNLQRPKTRFTRKVLIRLVIATSAALLACFWIIYELFLAYHE